MILAYLAIWQPCSSCRYRIESRQRMPAYFVEAYLLGMSLLCGGGKLIVDQGIGRIGEQFRFEFRFVHVGDHGGAAP